MRLAFRRRFEQLSALPDTTVLRDAPLSRYTRFGIGGPADLFAETRDPARFIDAWRIARAERSGHRRDRRRNESDRFR